MIILLGQNSILQSLMERFHEEGIDCLLFGNDPELKLLGYSSLQSVNDLLKELLPYKGQSLILSGGAPWLLKADFLQQFEPQGILNLHGTPLPQDRGGTIVSWLILNQKRIGVAAVHKMSPSPDEGPLLRYREFIYPAQCILPQDYLDVYNQQIEDLAWDLALAYSKGLLDTSYYHNQPHYLSSYWPRLSAKVNGAINWAWEGDEIERLIRAFDNPYPGAYTFWRGKTVHLKKCFFQYDSHYHPLQWGMVYRSRSLQTGGYLAVAVKGGTLYIQEATDQEGESVLEFIQEGDRLNTPAALLDGAKKRLIKSPKGLKVQGDLE